MSNKEEVEKLKKFMKEQGLDFDEYLEAKKEHNKRMKRLDKQLFASESEFKIHFKGEEE